MMAPQTWRPSWSIKTLVFDWGDTLMRVFPGCDGPMVNWPTVEALPGAKETLERLKPEFRLVIATNAADSGRQLVYAALDRVGLAGLIDQVYTTHELGKRKTDAGYYQTLMDAIGHPVSQAVMIGDDYRSDVEGAKSAGMKAIWFNPNKRLSETVHPVCDAQIDHLDRLIRRLEMPALPDINECLRLHHEFHLPDQIIRHSRVVAGAAYLLAGWLLREGCEVDPILTHRGALLHDLDKLASAERGRQHGDLSGDILAEKGQSELSRIARRHVLYTHPIPSHPESWEEKLVFYADKIVEGDQVVPLGIRREALLKRYPTQGDKIEANWAFVERLEGEISTWLRMEPADLILRVNQAVSA